VPAFAWHMKRLRYLGQSVNICRSIIPALHLHEANFAAELTANTLSRGIPMRTSRPPEEATHQAHLPWPAVAGHCLPSVGVESAIIAKATIPQLLTESATRAWPTLKAESHDHRQPSFATESPNERTFPVMIGSSDSCQNRTSTATYLVTKMRRGLNFIVLRV
jgi:hypothetical protein